MSEIDHADMDEPMERLREMADWLSDVKSDGETLLSRSVALEHSADIRTLIAENEALRVAVDAGQQVNRANHDLIAALRRERHAAVGLLRRTDPFTLTLAVGASELRGDIRAFLDSMEPKP